MVVLELVVGSATFCALLVATVAAELLGRGPATQAAVEQLSNHLESVLLPRALSLDWLTGLLALLAMHSVCEGLHGSTPGKRLVGVTVVGEEGGNATMRAGFVRSIGFVIDQMVLGLVGYMRIQRSPTRQRFGDEWAGTVVVRIAALEPARRRSGRRFAASTLAGLLAAGLVAFAVTTVRIHYGAAQAAGDAVRIARAVPQDARPDAPRPVAVRVDYSLRSADRGTIRCFVVKDGEVTGHEEARVTLGARSTSLVVSVPAARRGPGYPDSAVQIVVALFPGGNEEAPSATFSLDLALSP